MTRGLDVRIGINPISWSNDDLPSLGGETPLETALSEGKAIGYEGFEGFVAFHPVAAFGNIFAVGIVRSAVNGETHQTFGGFFGSVKGEGDYMGAGNCVDAELTILGSFTHGLNFKG